MLAGVRVEYYTKMERRHLRGVSGAVLDALAGGLQLDQAERDHLFEPRSCRRVDAAHGPPSGRPTRPAERAADHRRDDRRAEPRSPSGTPWSLTAARPPDSTESDP